LLEPLKEFAKEHCAKRKIRPFMLVIRGNKKVSLRRKLRTNSLKDMGKT